MLIPLSVVDDVAILDLALAQQHPRTHNNNNMLPVFVLFDSRTMSHFHHPTTPPSSLSHNLNNVPSRLMSHNRNNVSSRPTFSVVDETLVYDSHSANNIPRRSYNHQTGHPHHPTTTTTPSSSSHNHNNVPTRVMSHNRNNNISSRPTFSVVDEALVYDPHMANSIPRRSRIHPTRSFNHGHPHHRHHHNNGIRASAAVVMDVQEHVTTSTSDAAESICSICLVDLPNASSMPIRLRCSHVFHTHCIQKWINIRKTCPLCRADV